MNRDRIRGLVKSLKAQDVCPVCEKRIYHSERTVIIAGKRTHRRCRPR